MGTNRKTYDMFGQKSKGNCTAELTFKIMIEGKELVFKYIFKMQDHWDLVGHLTSVGVEEVSLHFI